MFRRKKSELEDEKSVMENTGNSNELGLGAPGARPAVALTPGKAPVMPTRPTEPPRSDARPAREIALSGEITSCDRLVVEGSVEANLANCRDIDIAESGLFKGSASIEEAEIRGRFEGTLTVRKRLHIRSTGKVVGTVRYGQIEIECGGQLSGDVQMLVSSEPASATPSLTPSLAKV